MRRLLVTGGAGFIGSNFVHYWLREHPGERLVVLDALTYAGNIENLVSLAERSELRFVHGDILDTALVTALLREERINTVVHFAAETHVDRSIHAPDKFIATNVLGTHALLQAARRVWLDEHPAQWHRFHHVSTDEVFGSLTPEEPASHERSPYAPSSPYAASKAASDHLVRAYHQTYGLMTTTSNCSNNYGPYHYPEKLIPVMIVHLLHGRPIPIYGDGRNVRDWLHVNDHCHAIDLILARGTPGERYNVGGGTESENIELARLLCHVVDRMFEDEPHLRSKYPLCPAARGGSTSHLISFVTDRPGHDRRYAIDCSRISRELGYRAQITLQEGLRDTVRWFLTNDGWWRRALERSYPAV